MNGSKPWYTSVTIWGALVSLFTAIAGLVHLHPDQQWQNDATQYLVAIGELVGGAVALIGRLRATRQIGAPLSPPNNGKLRAIGIGLIAAALLLLAGGCAQVSAPYVAADRATHDAIAPEYQAYVHADPNLSAQQKSRRDNTLATWELRIESAEAAEATTRPAP